MVLLMKKNLVVIFFILFWSNSVFAECIKGDCLEGFGIFKTKSGSILEGNFEKGVLNGKIKYTDSTGNIWILKYSNGTVDHIDIYEENLYSHNSIKNKEIININTYIFILNTENKANENEILEQLKAANKVWKQANIFWNLKKIEIIDPGLPFDKAKRFYYDNCKPMRSCFHNVLKKFKTKENYFKFRKKQMSVHSKLLNLKKNKKNDGVNIFFLPDNSIFNGEITAVATGHMTKEERYDNTRYILIPYKVVNLGAFGKMKADRRPLAHELGHILDLNHNKKKGHIMNMSVGSSSLISEEEALSSRKNAKIIFN